MMDSPIYLVADSRKMENIFTREALETPNLILTSPPYFDVKDYDGAESQLGRSQTYDQYLDDVAGVLQQCYRVSASNSTLWVVLDTIARKDITYPLPFDISRKLKDNWSPKTWKLRDVIIWNKSKNIPWHRKGRLKNEFEYVLFFSKCDKYKYSLDRVRRVADYKKWWLTYPERYSPQGKPPSNVWEFTIPIRGWGSGYQKHLCPLPFPLIERILSISSNPGDVVLDPFAGSGSVVALSSEMGRRAIGIDINERYKREFDEAVRIGARKYWTRREQELDAVHEGIIAFKEMNQKLRKIKAGLRLKEAICDGASAGADGLVFIAIDGKGATAQIDFVVCHEEGRIGPDPSSLLAVVRKVEREFKTEVRLLVKNRVEARNQLEGTSLLFGYASPRIYECLGAFPVTEVLSNGHSPNVLLCDIEVGIGSGGKPSSAP